jgi:hypothetical protein
MQTTNIILGDEHPSTANLALTYWNLALTYWNLALTYWNLALTYWNQGQWKEAEELQVRANCIFEALSLVGDAKPTSDRAATVGLKI